MKVIAIGASTGGPPALQQIFAQLDARIPLAVLVSQHMPPKFTAAFAERLDRGSALEVREAKTGDALRPGLALIAPGASHLTVERSTTGVVRARVEPAAPEDRYVPSVDRLFVSVARAFGSDAMGVVLTGMGGDGTRGVRAIKEAGGRTLAEAAESAVIFGMPEEAIKTGAIDVVVALRGIADAIMDFGRREAKEAR